MPCTGEYLTVPPGTPVSFYKPHLHKSDWASGSYVRPSRPRPAPVRPSVHPHLVFPSVNKQVDEKVRRCHHPGPVWSLLWGFIVTVTGWRRAVTAIPRGLLLLISTHNCCTLLRVISHQSIKLSRLSEMTFFHPRKRVFSHDLEWGEFTLPRD